MQTKIEGPSFFELFVATGAETLRCSECLFLTQHCDYDNDNDKERRKGRKGLLFVLRSSSCLCTFKKSAGCHNWLMRHKDVMHSHATPLELWVRADAADTEIAQLSDFLRYGITAVKVRA